MAILDSGVDYTHPDLTANLWTLSAPITLVLNGVSVTCAAGSKGFNALTESCDPMDDFGHGTHLAGIIGAAGNNAAGVAGVNQIRTDSPGRRLDVNAAVRTCLPRTKPVTPTGLAASASNAKVRLSWTAVPAAATYTIKSATSTKGPWTTIGSSSTASYVAGGLSNGTLYYFVVSAVNIVGESAASASVSAKPAVPAGPTGLAATAGEWSVSLNWGATIGAASYNVKRSTSATGPGRPSARPPPRATPRRSWLAARSTTSSCRR